MDVSIDHFDSLFTKDGLFHIRVSTGLFLMIIPGDIDYVKITKNDKTRKIVLRFIITRFTR